MKYDKSGLRSLANRILEKDAMGFVMGGAAYMYVERYTGFSKVPTETLFMTVKKG